jgi:hypothetical protein
MGNTIYRDLASFGLPLSLRPNLGLHRRYMTSKSTGAVRIAAR